MPSTRRQLDGVAARVSRRPSVDGVAARVSRRPSHRWCRGSLAARHDSPVASTGVNEAKLARGFKDLELEMGVNIDMCVYDDAEAVKMAA